jgi:hypothetical protein
MRERARHARATGRRIRAAKACLAAMALTWLVVPGLHALVHHAEEAREERVRQFALAHRHPHRHVHAQDRDRGHGHDHDLGDSGARHHHHDHDPGPGSPLRHGDGAPEHLGLALLESAPPEVPPPGAAIDSIAPLPPVTFVLAAARLRAHGSRAPPRDLASHRFT